MEGGDFWKAPGALGAILCVVMVFGGGPLLVKLFQHLQSLWQADERRKQLIRNLRTASEWLDENILPASFVAARMDGLEPLEVLFELQQALCDLTNCTANNGSVNHHSLFVESLRKLRKILKKKSGRKVIEDLCEEQRGSQFAARLAERRGGSTYLSLRWLVNDLCKFYTPVEETLGPVKNLPVNS